MDPLARRIAEFIRGEIDASEDTFNDLACQLFARQYALNAPYRRLCDSENMPPRCVTRWQDIPAVPAQAFKSFVLSCEPLEQIVATFHSSGTTGPQTSRHFLTQDALDLYEISLCQGYQAALPDAPHQLWALMPLPEYAPHSSLSHMLSALKASRFFWDDDTALHNALTDAVLPVTLFGTAFAFVSLFDSTNALWHLPSGSCVIETGGFKGRTREVPREELYALFTERLGVPASRCFSEYGMSEMASQFYGRGFDPVKRGPHWVRTRAIDPVTGTDAGSDTPGLLRHCDLANFNSVLALQTQDLGTLTSDGFVLHGRATDADVRGCSLTVEELWLTQ